MRLSTRPSRRKSTRSASGTRHMGARREPAQYRAPEAGALGCAVDQPSIHQRYADTFRHGYNIVDHDFRDPQTACRRTLHHSPRSQAAGPDRMPPPPPPAPCDRTAPVDGAPGFAAVSVANFRAASSSTSAPPRPPCCTSGGPARTGGISMLAEYEARGGAPAPAPM